jgi:hypothetical protein
MIVLIVFLPLTEFLPNPSSISKNNTTFLLDWLHQQYPSIANHFHQHIQSMEHLPNDDGIRVTGVDISCTSNIVFPSSSDDYHPSSNSTDVSTLYNELTNDNKQALLTQALLTKNSALINHLLLLTSKNTSITLANLSEKLLTHAENTKYQSYDMTYKQTNVICYITIGSRDYYQ